MSLTAQDRPPAPRPVRLVLHDPAWFGLAGQLAAQLRAAAPSLRAVHHIGSTAIEGLTIKPITDLLAVVSSLDALDADRAALASLGYGWHGPNGIDGRRFCTLDDPATGRRVCHLHCFAEGDAAIARHLAFREHLRADPVLASAYAAIKQDCARRHPDDSGRYADCNSDWIRRIERAALGARDSG